MRKAGELFVLDQKWMQQANPKACRAMREYDEKDRKSLAKRNAQKQLREKTIGVKALKLRRNLVKE